MTHEETHAQQELRGTQGAKNDSRNTCRPGHNMSALFESGQGMKTRQGHPSVCNVFGSRRSTWITVPAQYPNRSIRNVQSMHWERSENELKVQYPIYRAQRVHYLLFGSQTFVRSARSADFGPIGVLHSSHGIQQIETPRRLSTMVKEFKTSEYNTAMELWRNVGDHHNDALVGHRLFFVCV